eukprot:PITA_36717
MSKFTSSLSITCPSRPLSRFIKSTLPFILDSKRKNLSISTCSRSLAASAIVPISCQQRDPLSLGSKRAASSEAAPGLSLKRASSQKDPEATSHDEWKEVMQKEYDALIKNDTWKLVDRPFGTKTIGCKWVYKDKYKADGSLDKHKARLVAKGFAQKEGVDYEESFSPTSKWATIRTLFALAAQNS